MWTNDRQYGKNIPTEPPSGQDTLIYLAGPAYTYGRAYHPPNRADL
ncbi:hypothetical protein SAMN06264855_1119 [Halorubrum vacuolatum]|uniref:Uncharacterized protein n=1 Tax=Halorubrum vacuolatum TaxID=63740 RepID=A0A238WXD1_HALVU|nr:hypothetical protein SAMN06264855_1119 [Halorubrum vacuolatum]